MATDSPEEALIRLLDFEAHSHTEHPSSVQVSDSLSVYVQCEYNILYVRIMETTYGVIPSEDNLI